MTGKTINYLGVKSKKTCPEDSFGKSVDFTEDDNNLKEKETYSTHEGRVISTPQQVRFSVMVIGSPSGFYKMC